MACSRWRKGYEGLCPSCERGCASRAPWSLWCVSCVRTHGAVTGLVWRSGCGQLALPGTLQKYPPSHAFPPVFTQYSCYLQHKSSHSLVFIPQSPLVQAVPPSHITPAKGCSRAGLGAGLPGWAFSSHLSTGFSTRVPVIVRIRKWLADLGKDQPSLKYLRRVAVIQVQHDYTEHVLLGLLSGHWYFLWVCCKLYVPHRSTVHLVSCCTCPKSICHFWNCYLYAIVVSFRMCVQLLFCTFFFFSPGFPYVLACRPSLVFCQMCQQ